MVAGHLTVEMEDLEEELEVIITLKPEEQEGIQEGVPAITLSQEEAEVPLILVPIKIIKPV